MLFLALLLVHVHIYVATSTRTTCRRGEYASPITLGGCAKCSQGWYQPASDTHTRVCLRCPAGQWSAAGSAMCADRLSTTSAAPQTKVPCAPGTYRLAAGLPCTSCPMNTVQPRRGASGCERCPPGSHASDDRTKCVSEVRNGECGPGQYRVGGEAPTCALCPVGRFMPFATHTNAECYACHTGCRSQIGAPRCSCGSKRKHHIVSYYTLLY